MDKNYYLLSDQYMINKVDVDNMMIEILDYLHRYHYLRFMTLILVFMILFLFFLPGEFHSMDHVLQNLDVPHLEPTYR